MRPAVLPRGKRWVVPGHQDAAHATAEFGWILVPASVVWKQPQTKAVTMTLQLVFEEKPPCCTAIQQQGTKGRAKL